MHPNLAFRGTCDQVSLAFAAARGFATLCIADPAGGIPLLAHLPIMIEGHDAHLHLVRSNPIARHLAQGSSDAILSVTGPDGYISPDWYGLPDQVPTWNYIAIHLHGALSLRPATDLPDLLARQSAQFEAALAPKRPWTMDKMSDGTVDRMMRQILPATLKIARIESTWKLGQNKPDTARHAAAAALDPLNPALADWMRAPPDPTSS